MPARVVNVYRGQPRNYWYIRLFYDGIFFVLNEVEFASQFPNFEELLADLGGVDAGIVLSSILRRLGC